ncbi:glycine--tRNA ligase subunit beta, partial [Escherichia coli]
VVAQQPDVLDNVVERLQAVQAFAALPEAEALAAANKRITNILKKIEGVAIDAHGAVQENLLQEAAEQGLFAAMQTTRPQVQ